MAEGEDTWASRGVSAVEVAFAPVYAAMIYAIQAIGSRGLCGHGKPNPGLIKIGKAKDPEKRLKVLATGSPFPLQLMASVDWDDEIERLIHAAFKRCRRNGEWFEPTPVVASFVSTMMCTHGANDEQKFGACMLILVEMLAKWPTRHDLKYGACRAPDMRDPEMIRAETTSSL